MLESRCSRWLWGESFLSTKRVSEGGLYPTINLLGSGGTVIGVERWPSMPHSGVEITLRQFVKIYYPFPDDGESLWPCLAHRGLR